MGMGYFAGYCLMCMCDDVVTFLWLFLDVKIECHVRLLGSGRYVQTRVFCLKSQGYCLKHAWYACVRPSLFFPGMGKAKKIEN